MKKIFGVAALMIASFACAAKTVVVTTEASGSSPADANRKSFESAQIRALMFEPAAVYVETIAISKDHKDKASHTIVHVPAEISDVELLSSDISTLISDEHLIAEYKHGQLVNALADEHGNPEGTRYTVRNTFRFTIVPAEDRDRAKLLGNYKAMESIISLQDLPSSSSTFQQAGYGVVAAQIDKAQAEALAKSRARSQVDSLPNWSEIEASFQYFFNNLPAAIVNTYQSPVVESVETSGSGRITEVMIQLGRGCELDGPKSMDQAGTTCDLIKQVAPQILDAVSRFGIIGGNYSETLSPAIDKNHPGQLLRRFITQPFTWVPMAKQTLQTSGLPTREIQFEYAQWLMPTSRAANVPPVGFGWAVAQYRRAGSTPSLAATDYYQEKILPPLIAASLLSGDEIVMSVLDLATSIQYDIPLVTTSGVLNSGIILQFESDGLKRSKSDYVVQISLRRLPKKEADQSGSKANVAYRSLPRYPDTQAKLDALMFYKEQKGKMKVVNMPEMLSVAMSSLASCSGSSDACMRYPFASLVLVGSAAQINNPTSPDLEWKVSGVDDECWMPSPTSQLIGPCHSIISEIRESWWASLGMRPISTSLTRNENGDLHLDIEKSELGGAGRVIPSSNYPLFW
ncbi:hypothetical protein [Thalassolituus marinus]|uniref:Uncharacterized protein n=1 Tax=Thalassolituus marinus TaxID=671053 RepID=A0ABS7ZYB4_9GAMM|nr:hypothetical protein [Thalassolituus marinus]MCA6065446.1 hypothetical protein [Thalassolituus marinus]